MTLRGFKIHVYSSLSQAIPLDKFRDTPAYTKFSRLAYGLRFNFRKCTKTFEPLLDFAYIFFFLSHLPSP